MPRRRTTQFTCRGRSRSVNPGKAYPRRGQLPRMVRRPILVRSGLSFYSEESMSLLISSKHGRQITLSRISI